MPHALHAAATLRCNTLQIFVKNQRQWDAPPLSDPDVQQWHALRQKLRIAPILAHASYLINLAAHDARHYRRSQQALADELHRCDQLAIDYLVVHPGAAGPSSPRVACRRAFTALNRVFDRNRSGATRVLLEATAGQGTTLGRSFDELATLLDGVDCKRRVGICLDTCHLFAAGYDLRNPETYAAMIAEANRTIGIDRIRAWHFNDSVGDFGSRRDRHAHIGHGCIGIAGFRNILADRRFEGLPMILETPKGENDRGRDWDRVNLQRLRTLSTRLHARH